MGQEHPARTQRLLTVQGQFPRLQRLVRSTNGLTLVCAAAQLAAARSHMPGEHCAKVLEIADLLESWGQDRTLSAE